MSPLDHVVAVGRLLESIDAPWVLGGSLASSLVGEPRSTMDVDVAARFELARVAEFVARVEHDYYVSADMVRDAVVRHSSFNLIHFASGMKIDVFALSDDLLDVRQLERREEIEVTPTIRVWVGAPDDQVLRKLAWFREGGEVSDRQWRDVLSILRVQGDRIDRDQLLADAAELGLGELAVRAIEQTDR